MTTSEREVLEAAKDRRRAEVEIERVLRRMRAGELGATSQQYDRAWGESMDALQRENDALDRMLFSAKPQPPLSGAETAAILAPWRRDVLDA